MPRAQFEHVQNPSSGLVERSYAVIVNNDIGCGGSGDGWQHAGRDDEGNEDVDGGDGKSKADCRNDVIGDSGDKNNGDDIDDSGININCGDDTN